MVRVRLNKSGFSGISPARRRTAGTPPARHALGITVGFSEAYYGEI